MNTIIDLQALAKEVQQFCERLQIEPAKVSFRDVCAHLATFRERFNALVKGF